jgi:hypothetical protein
VDRQTWGWRTAIACTDRQTSGWRTTIACTDRQTSGWRTAIACTHRQTRVEERDCHRCVRLSFHLPCITQPIRSSVYFPPLHTAPVRRCAEGSFNCQCVCLSVRYGASLPSGVSWGILAVICVFINGFAWSWGPIGWLYPTLETLNPKPKTLKCLELGAHWVALSNVGHPKP